MSTPTPDPWIADGYDLRQKHGRMIAYFGPHHTPADEYPLSCRLQDEANCQWVANARNELAAEREKVRVLREALQAIRALNPTNMCGDHWGRNMGLEPDDVFDLCDAALAATKEDSR